MNFIGLPRIRFIIQLRYCNLTLVFNYNFVNRSILGSIYWQMHCSKMSRYWNQRIVDSIPVHGHFATLIRKWFKFVVLTMSAIIANRCQTSILEQHNLLQALLIFYFHYRQLFLHLTDISDPTSNWYLWSGILDESLWTFFYGRMGLCIMTHIS